MWAKALTGGKRLLRDGCYQIESGGRSGGPYARDSQAGCHRPADVAAVFAKLDAFGADALVREGAAEGGAARESAPGGGRRAAARGAPVGGLGPGESQSRIVLVRPDGSRWVAANPTTATQLLAAVNELPSENQWYATPPAKPVGAGPAARRPVSDDSGRRWHSAHRSVARERRPLVVLPQRPRPARRRTEAAREEAGAGDCRGCPPRPDPRGGEPPGARRSARRRRQADGRRRDLRRGRLAGRGARPAAAATAGRRRGRSLRRRDAGPVTGVCNRACARHAMSSVVEIVDSRALAGNPLGDATARRIAVWLPPSYAIAPDRRYPVIYWLSGYAGTGEMLFSGTPWQPGLGDRLDRLVGVGRDGRGDRRRARRLHPLGRRAVPRFAGDRRLRDARRARGDPGDRRALPHRRGARRARASAASRRAASARWCSRCATPELFAAVASHAGDMYFELSALPDLPVAARTLRRHGGVAGFLRHFEAKEKKDGADFTTIMVLAQAGAYSPDPGRANGIALPFDLDTGEIDWTVWQRWKAWDPGRDGGDARRGAAADEADLHRRGHARRTQPGPRRAHLRPAAADAGHRVRAPGVRRRPPRHRVPLRRLAAHAGGRDRRDQGRG